MVIRKLRAKLMPLRPHFARVWGPVRTASVAFLSRTHFTAWATLETKQRLKVDLSSTVGRSIWYRGEYERQVEAQLRRRLKGGNVFVDVGANVGYFSVITAEIVGPGGAVHAFEPDQRSCDLLKASLTANRLTNVYANAIALWKEPGCLQFAPERQSGLSHVLSQQESLNVRPALSVPANTLDRYMKTFPVHRVRLVKIDAEGADLAVLLGMREILARDRPTVIVETEDWALARFGHTVEDLINYLDSFGYAAYDLDGRPIHDSGEARERLANYFVKNLVFDG